MLGRLESVDQIQGLDVVGRWINQRFFVGDLAPF